MIGCEHLTPQCIEDVFLFFVLYRSRYKTNFSERHDAESGG
jgi:hypothetical protein